MGVSLQAPPPPLPGSPSGPPAGEGGAGGGDSGKIEASFWVTLATSWRFELLGCFEAFFAAFWWLFVGDPLNLNSKSFFPSSTLLGCQAFFEAFL